MKKLMVVFAFLIASLSPGFAQNQIDAATRQDVRDLMELTGARERFTHSDIMDINGLLPTDQKLPKNTNAMMIGAIEGAQAVMNKHMPAMVEQIEKPAADTSQPALTRPQ